jgi:hypothetical protein
MKLADAALGALVRRHGGEGALIPDASRTGALRGRRTGRILEIRGARILVGWLDSAAHEWVACHRLEPTTGNTPEQPAPISITATPVHITATLVAPDRLQLGWAFPGIATPWATRIHRRRSPRRARTTPLQLELPLV